MTTTSTAGADWKGGGEIKALRRIVGGSAEEDQDAPAPVGHNHPPQAAVYETTGAEIALEEQALVVERIFGEADRVTERLGQELIKLRESFCAVEMGKQARIVRLRAEGRRNYQIAIDLGLSESNVCRHLKCADAGKQIGIDHATNTRFIKWAADRFKRRTETLRSYMTRARHPGTERARKARAGQQIKANRQIVKLMLASQNGKVAPPVFKQAVLALGDRGAPQRTATLCWWISLDVGSEDPQEVARWFAAHRLV